jgi:hypothetical protein
MLPVSLPLNVWAQPYSASQALGNSLIRKGFFEQGEFEAPDEQ